MFWTNSTEPLRQHRWYVSISPPGIKDTVYALKKVDKPKAKIGEITHKYLNHFFYYPGRLEWEPINMTFASIGKSSSTAKALFDVLTGAGYGIPQGGPMPGATVSTIGKAKFNATLGSTIEIFQVDPDGEIIETWYITNPFFTSVQFGSLDYANEDIVEITTTIRYDYALLKVDDVGKDKENAMSGVSAELKQEP